MRKIAAAAACAALLVPATASAAPASPFGHACADQDGVLFCPSTGLDDRVPSWDGVPLDVDVTLPETGDGPFPTIVMMHGLGGSKTDFETADDTGSGSRPFYKNRLYAKPGHPGRNKTARGYRKPRGKAGAR